MTHRPRCERSTRRSRHARTPSLTLSRAQWEQMRDYVAAQAPLEACGLIGGRDGAAMEVIPVRNAAQSPVRFRMEPLEQLRAFEQLESAGMEMLAIFHSHPQGPAGPSPADIAEAFYQVIQVIWSPGEGEWLSRAFWIEAGHAAEVPLTVIN